jgi:hypothetical protein
MLIVIVLAVYIAERGARLIQTKPGSQPDLEEFVPEPGEVWVNLLPGMPQVRPKQIYRGIAYGAVYAENHANPQPDPCSF